MSVTSVAGWRFRHLGMALLLLAAALPGRRADAGERLGTVSFEVSCAPAVRGDFERGVALLHDFWYEEARPQFEAILERDPGCAMAHWGVAMSVFHQIWDRPDEAAMAAGWHELQAAAARPARSARERGYVAALASFYRPDARDYQARIEAYSSAMGKLHEAYARDVDAAAFYALHSRPRAPTARLRPPARMPCTCPVTSSRASASGRRTSPRMPPRCRPRATPKRATRAAGWISSMRMISSCTPTCRAARRRVRRP